MTPAALEEAINLQYREGPHPMTPHPSSSFTLVFEGDIRKFKFNPLKQETAFGVPVIASVGNALESEWQSINTAPTNGDHFLAYQRDRGPFECWMHTDWPKSECWWMDYADSEPQPTHWMPLPEPPHP